MLAWLKPEPLTQMWRRVCDHSARQTLGHGDVARAGQVAASREVGLLAQEGAHSGPEALQAGSRWQVALAVPCCGAASLSGWQAALRAP